MSHEDTACFPPLACRMIVNPAKGGEKDEKPLRIPPFSEIDLKNWDGFFFSYLQWLGFKDFERSGAKNRDVWHKPWEKSLIFAHEMRGHGLLSHMPFSQLKKFKMISFYNLMLEIFEGGREKISIPLNRNKPGNTLKERYKVLVRMHKASELIEEVYAVRKSLLCVRDEWKILNAEWQEITEEYKEAYSEVIPGFRITYELLDVIANTFGEPIAEAVIQAAFNTGRPDRAFGVSFGGRTG